jgi:hypothetical protein
MGVSGASSTEQQALITAQVQYLVCRARRNMPASTPAYEHGHHVRHNREAYTGRYDVLTKALQSGRLLGSH